MWAIRLVRLMEPLVQARWVEALLARLALERWHATLSADNNTHIASAGRRAGQGSKQVVVATLDSQRSGGSQRSKLSTAPSRRTSCPSLPSTTGWPPAPRVRGIHNILECVGWVRVLNAVDPTSKGHTWEGGVWTGTSRLPSLRVSSVVMLRSVRLDLASVKPRCCFTDTST